MLLEEELSYKVRGCIYAVASKYGKGLKEKVYQNALEEELLKNKINFVSQKVINIYSLDTGKVLGTYVPDLVVENKIVIEIKATPFTLKSDIEQQGSYLRASQYEIALLVNFCTEPLDIKRSIYTNDRKPFISLLKQKGGKYSVSPSFSVSDPSQSVKSGMTLLETLVVIGLIGILSSLVIFLINPTRQLQKSWDSQRKTHLAYFQRIFNDYYNDHTSYPSGPEICFDQPVHDNGICTCSVCGAAGNNSSLKPYTTRLGCDPEFSHKKYLYQYDCSQSVTQWYRLCAQLSENTIVKNADGSTNYNYEINSGNIDKGECNTIVMVSNSGYGTISPTSPVLPSPTSQAVPTITSNPLSVSPTAMPTQPPSTPPVGSSPTPTPLMCQTFPGPKYCFNGPNCNLCGNVSQCNVPPNCDNPSQLFLNPTCQTACSQ